MWPPESSNTRGIFSFLLPQKCFLFCSYHAPCHLTAEIDVPFSFSISYYSISKPNFPSAPMWVLTSIQLKKGTWFWFSRSSQMYVCLSLWKKLYHDNSYRRIYYQGLLLGLHRIGESSICGSKNESGISTKRGESVSKGQQHWAKARKCFSCFRTHMLGG